MKKQQQEGSLGFYNKRNCQNNFTDNPYATPPPSTGYHHFILTTITTTTTPTKQLHIKTQTQHRTETTSPALTTKYTH